MTFSSKPYILTYNVIHNNLIGGKITIMYCSFCEKDIGWDFGHDCGRESNWDECLRINRDGSIEPSHGDCGQCRNYWDCPDPTVKTMRERI